MRKTICLILLLLLPSLIFASLDKAEEILFKAYTNSIYEDLFITLEKTLVYIEGYTSVKLNHYDKDKEYLPLEEYVKYFTTKDGYKKLTVPIYSDNGYDAGLIQRKLEYENEFYYYKVEEDKIYKKLQGGSSTFTRDEDDGEIKLRPELVITRFEDVIYEGVPCYFIELKNTWGKTTIKFWIEKERNVRLRKDTLLRGNLLDRRITAKDFIQIGDSYIEKQYTIWSKNNGNYITIVSILDPQFRDIDDKFFEPEILRFI